MSEWIRTANDAMHSMEGLPCSNFLLIGFSIVMWIGCNIGDTVTKNYEKLTDQFSNSLVSNKSII